MAAPSKAPLEPRIDPRTGALVNATAAADRLLAERGDRPADEVHNRRAGERAGDLTVERPRRRPLDGWRADG